MKPVLILTDAGRPDLDTIIVWDHGDRLVAYGYHQGHLTRTQPVEPEHATPDALRHRFQLPRDQQFGITYAAGLPQTTHRPAIEGRWR